MFNFADLDVSWLAGNLYIATDIYIFIPHPSVACMFSMCTAADYANEAPAKNTRQHYIINIIVNINIVNINIIVFNSFDT